MGAWLLVWEAPRRSLAPGPGALPRESSQLSGALAFQVPRTFPPVLGPPWWSEVPGTFIAILEVGHGGSETYGAVHSHALSTEGWSPPPAWRARCLSQK